MDKRRAILLCDYVITADETAGKKNSVDIRGISSMSGIYRLVVQVRDAGSSAPTGAVSFVVQVQDADPDGLVFADVSGFVNTAIAATGNGVAVKDLTGVLGTKARASVTVSAATAWNDGTRIKAWLIGEAA